MLEARSAIDPLPPCFAAGGGMTLEERRDLVVLRLVALGNEGTLTNAFGSLPPPGAVLETGEGARLVGLRPDQWLLLTPDPAGRDGSVARSWRERLPGVAVMDEGHKHVAIVLDGPAAEAVLQKGLSVDLDPSAFPLNGAIQAGLAGHAVLVLREAGGRFLLAAQRSFAADLIEWIYVTAAPFTGHAGR